MKVGAFLLGMLFGMIVILGALAGAIWYAVAVLTPDQVTNNQASDYVGDYGKMSLKNIYDDVMKKFETYRGKYYDYNRDADGNIKYDADGKPQLVEVSVENGGQYITLGMFCATSGIDLTKLLVGKEVPQSIMDVPVMEYFNGSDGVQRALSQIKVSILPDIMNMFTTTDEDGNTVVNKAAIDKLNGYSISDLMSENGIEKVFSEVKLADLVSKYFPQAEESGKELLYALGQTTVGGILKAMRGGNPLVEIKASGALEKLGTIKVTQLVSSEDEMLQNAFGNATLASLVDDSGKLNTDSMMSQIKVGSIMGYKYDSDSERWYTIDGDGNKTYAEGTMATLANLSIKEVVNVSNLNGLYVGELLGYKRIEVSANDYYRNRQTFTDDSGNDVLYVAQNLTGEYAASVDDKTWYKATFTCEETHTHTADCYDFTWYQICNNPTDCATHDGHEIVDGKTYGKIQELYQTLANVTFGDLTSGKVNFNDTLNNLTLVDILGEDGIPSQLASLKDVKIGELGNRIKTIRIAELLEYTRTDLTANADNYTAVGTLDTVKVKDREYIKADGDYWYKAKLVCDDEKHDTLTKHTADCFDYVWTKDAVEPEGIMAQFASLTVNELSDSAALNNRIQEIKLGDVMTIDENDKPLGALKNVKIKNLSTSFNTLTLSDVIAIDNNSAYVLRNLANTPISEMSTKFNSLTLADVVEIGEDSPQLLKTLKNENINKIGDKLETITLGEVVTIDSTSSPMLRALADKKVNNIATELDNMKMGVMLGYTEATSDSHTSDAHWHDESGNLVKGIYAKIADKTVSNMSGEGLKDVVGNLTMGDLLDSGMMSLGEGDAGKNNEYKLAIIYCGGTHSNGLTSTKCTIENYFAYKTANSSDTMSAMNFYLLTHNITDESGMTTAQIAHRDVWKEETLSDFITLLFSVL